MWEFPGGPGLRVCTLTAEGLGSVLGQGYNYTVEVTNRFKGLDLIDRVPEEL